MWIIKKITGKQKCDWEMELLVLGHMYICYLWEILELREGWLCIQMLNYSNWKLELEVTTQSCGRMKASPSDTSIPFLECRFGFQMLCFQPSFLLLHPCRLWKTWACKSLPSLCETGALTHGFGLAYTWLAIWGSISKWNLSHSLLLISFCSLNISSHLSKMELKDKLILMHISHHFFLFYETILLIWIDYMHFRDPILTLSIEIYRSI